MRFSQLQLRQSVFWKGVKKIWSLTVAQFSYSLWRTMNEANRGPKWWVKDCNLAPLLPTLSVYLLVTRDSAVNADADTSPHFLCRMGRCMHTERATPHTELGWGFVNFSHSDGLTNSSVNESAKKQITFSQPQPQREVLNVEAEWKRVTQRSVKFQNPFQFSWTIQFHTSLKSIPIQNSPWTI